LGSSYPFNMLKALHYHHKVCHKASPKCADWKYLTIGVTSTTQVPFEVASSVYLSLLFQLQASIYHILAMFYYQLLHKFRLHSITLLPSCVSPHCLNCVYYFVVFLGYVISINGVCTAIDVVSLNFTCFSIHCHSFRSYCAILLCFLWFPTNPNRNV
jgi:hypothetical protein